MRSLRLPVLATMAASAIGLAVAQAQTSAPQDPAAADWSAAQTLEVDLTNFAFSPSRLELKAGAAYRLHFVNRTSGGHDFTAKAFFNEAVIDPEDQAAVKDGMIMLGGNQSADVRLIAPKAGQYEARCTHLMHATLGMKGEVLVQ
jgi:uncharacterized cupredoxin-like copper-binding protein